MEKKKICCQFHEKWSHLYTPPTPIQTKLWDMIVLVDSFQEQKKIVPKKFFVPSGGKLIFHFFQNQHKPDILQKIVTAAIFGVQSIKNMF